MDLPEFKSKIKEVCKKAVMLYDLIPFSYDPDRKEAIYIDDEGYFNLLDNESYKFVKTHFNIKNILAIKYNVFCNDPEIDEEDIKDVDYLDVSESYIFILFNDKERIVVMDTIHDFIKDTVFLYIKKELENDDTVEFFNRIKNTRIEGYKFKITFDTDENGDFYD